MIFESGTSTLAVLFPSLHSNVFFGNYFPDIVIGCIGGGGSFSGLYWPFYYDKVSGEAPKDVEFLAVEPAACSSVTKGFYMYNPGLKDFNTRS